MLISLFHAQAAHRILVMRCCVNIFRLLRLLVQRVPDRITLLPLGRMMMRERGVSITFKMDSVVKRVKSFNTQLNCNPDFNIVREVIAYYVVL